MSFGPTYDVSDTTYIVKAGSSVTNFAMLDQPGVKIAAVNNTTTMRGTIAHLKNAKVTGYQSYDEIFNLLKNGEVDAFALAREQLDTMARKNSGFARAGRSLQADHAGCRGAAQSSARAGVCDQIHDGSDF